MMELAFVSAPDIVVIFIVALLIFGPKRLPEVGRQLGQMVGEMRKLTSEFTDVFHQTHDDIRHATRFDDPQPSRALIRPPLDQAHEDQIPEDELIAQSARLSAEPPADLAGPATHSGLVISTLPQPPSEGGV